MIPVLSPLLKVACGMREASAIGRSRSQEVRLLLLRLAAVEQKDSRGAFNGESTKIGHA